VEAIHSPDASGAPNNLNFRIPGELCAIRRKTGCSVHAETGSARNTDHAVQVDGLLASRRSGRYSWTSRYPLDQNGEPR
jgi:hypothetical protein